MVRAITTTLRGEFLKTLVFVMLPLSSVLGQARIIQTNSRGDMVHIIDPKTQSVVGQIKGVPVNHGVAAAPDGSRTLAQARPNTRCASSM